MSDALLSPHDVALVDAVAERVLELLDERAATTGVVAGRSRLVSATEVAALLGVTRDWVYGHADELGAVRIGNGTRSRLRFDADKATARVSSSASHHSDPPAAADRSRRRRRKELGSDVQLLPVKD